MCGFVALFVGKAMPATCIPSLGSCPAGLPAGIAASVAIVSPCARSASIAKSRARALLYRSMVACVLWGDSLPLWLADRVAACMNVDQDRINRPLIAVTQHYDEIRHDIVA